MNTNNYIKLSDKFNYKKHSNLEICGKEEDDVFFKELYEKHKQEIDISARNFREIDNLDLVYAECLWNYNDCIRTGEYTHYIEHLKQIDENYLKNYTCLCASCRPIYIICVLRSKIIYYFIKKIYLYFMSDYLITF